MKVDQLKIILVTMIKELVIGSDKKSYSEFIQEASPIIDNILTRCEDTNIVYADTNTERAYSLCLDTYEDFAENNIRSQERISLENSLTKRAVERFINRLDDKDIAVSMMMYTNGNSEDCSNDVVSLLDENKVNELSLEIQYLFSLLINTECLAVKRLFLIRKICEYSFSIEGDPTTIKHIVNDKFNSLEHSIDSVDYIDKLINHFCISDTCSDPIGEKEYEEITTKLICRYNKISSILLNIEEANVVIPFLKAVSKY
ncbi:MAG: hypothetical protein ACRCX2_39020 [Paraclostridium sp.]